MISLLVVMLLCNEFYSLDSSCASDHKKFYYQQIYNFIQNMHNFDVKFLLYIVDETWSLDNDVTAIFFGDTVKSHGMKTAKVLYSWQQLNDRRFKNFTENRDYAAVFLMDNKGIANKLSISMQLPLDLIKVFVDFNGCKLNETELSQITIELWRSEKIAFIYYITFCSNYDAIDIAKQKPHKDNCNYTINLFYIQPFERDSAGEWGRLVKIDLINDVGDGKRHWINMSSQVFHSFPFKRKNNINFNRMNLTVILFPSTMAFLRSDMNIFRKYLNKQVLENPSGNHDAYFGIDPEVLRELNAQLNFTLVISPTSDLQMYGFKQPDGSFNGALGDIIGKRADFIINAVFIKDYLTQELLEFTTAINDDKLCIALRTAPLVPDSLLIFSLFTKSVWIAILITTILVSAVYTLLMTLIDSMKCEKYESQNKFFGKRFCIRLGQKIKSDTNIFLRIIAILLGAPSIVGFGSTFHERLFVSTCLLWSLNFNGAFQGSLYDVYTTPKSYANIDTMDDLYASNLRIHVRHPGLLTDIFGDELPGTSIGNLRTRLRTSSDDFLNKRIAAKGDIAALERYANYEFENTKLTPREDGKSNLHLVGECPRSYTLAYLFRKRSIYLETINWKINMFMQSGLTVKWQKEMSFYFKLENALKHRGKSNNIKVKLNLGHLEMAFVALFIGNVISSVVFAYEKISRQRF